MRRTGTLYDLPENDLAALARRASARAVRKIRNAGLTPSGIEPAARGNRKATASQLAPAPPRRAKATARGA